MSGVHDDEAYARLLQKELLDQERALAEQERQHSPHADAELARRLQEMERMELSGPEVFGNPDARRQQEVDARLARILAESGGSFKDLNVQRIAAEIDGPQEEPNSQSQQRPAINPNGMREVPLVGQSCESRESSAELSSSGEFMRPRQQHRLSPPRSHPGEPRATPQDLVDPWEERQRQLNQEHILENIGSLPEPKGASTDSGDSTNPDNILAGRGAILDIDEVANAKQNKPSVGLLKMKKLFKGRENNRSVSPKPEGTNKGKWFRGNVTPPRQASTPSAPSSSIRNPLPDETIGGSVVKFPIPKPQHRPADTIGAPKGPLPYSFYASRKAPIQCSVCSSVIPTGPDGSVSYVKHPFFDTELMCPKHARNMTRRCTGCHRFEPEHEPFADLNDVGRCVCMACCRSVIVDSQDAQPLWTKVVQFFESKLNLPIWRDFKEIPILVVGYNALNDQMHSSCNVHGGANQIMTRGLCLTEHESGRRFRMNRQRFDSDSLSFVASDVEERGFTYFQVPDANKVNPDARVTAIFCLSGLPRDLAASVLAHEATHAWIKLHPLFNFERPIPPQIEEGCAQLIALLFLNDGLDKPTPPDRNDTGPSDEKLRQYFKFSIETEENELYGTGYRRAAKAYAHIGIEALMNHIVRYQEFPET